MRHTSMRRSLAAALVASSLMFTPVAAEAFCGFYVSGADAKLFNNATMVVMMRQGTRTVLSMQNNYQGPPADFALVVPVPVVLQEENVKTLPNEVFDRVDQLAAPRLVEYWEQDPCNVFDEEDMDSAAPMGGARKRSKAKGKKEDLGVTVEAEFEVGEYQVVILSAKDSGGLDTWLKREKYKIPAGAEPALRPYVQRGMKFFVAKVDTKKVKFEGGQAMLSPLRFHYDSDEFSLPVRLGMLNSAGTQDLIVHILARGQRYDVANYDNVTIPTNLDVTDETRKHFGPFYASLFDRTMEKHPKAVVTEYSWDAGSCDPCPTPPLTFGDVVTLGADVIDEQPGSKSGASKPSGAPKKSKARRKRRRGSGFVLTRLHARYDKAGLGEDLVFRAAPPIVGGREFVVSDGQLEIGAKPGGVNNFQARYAIRHEWKGPITCENPQRGIWGGPPNGQPPKPTAARKLAFVARDAELTSFVPKGVPELGVLAAPKDASPPDESAKEPPSAPSGVETAPTPPSPSGCGSCTTGQRGRAGGFAASMLLAVAALWRRKRRASV